MRPKAIVVDIDGTVSTRCDRDPFDLTLVAGDYPIQETLFAVKAMELYGYQIVYLTARGEEARVATEKWLVDWDCRGDFQRPLYMRKLDDRREDVEIKYEIYANDIAPVYDVKIALDDNPHVIKMWRDLGILGWQVASGAF